jgi:hypothetical protein
MKYSSIAILLLTASSVAGFRDQSQIKPNRDHRRFLSEDPVCTVDDEKGQSDKEVSVEVTALPSQGKGLFKVKFKNTIYR